MPQIVRECGRFHDIGVNNSRRIFSFMLQVFKTVFIPFAEMLRNAASYLSNFQGVREPIMEYLRLGGRYDLRYSTKAAKSRRVKNAIAIPLIRCALIFSASRLPIASQRLWRHQSRAIGFRRIPPNDSASGGG